MIQAHRLCDFLRGVDATTPFVFSPLQKKIPYTKKSGAFLSACLRTRLIFPIGFLRCPNLSLWRPQHHEVPIRILQSYLTFHPE